MTCISNAEQSSKRYNVTSLKKDFIYSLETQRERERQRQREKQAPCRKPDVGFDPGTAGSRPEPQADAQLLSHPGVPEIRL